MKTLEKIFNTLAQNLGYVILLLVAIVLFAIYADGLLSGLIAALSAFIAYICVVKLYNEFTKKSKK